MAGAWSGVILVPAALVLSTGEWFGHARSIRFGPLFPHADIALENPDGTTQPCASIDHGRRRRCPDSAVIEMATVHRLLDWQVGWPAATPAITVRADHPVHLSIQIPVHLEGDYIGTCWSCTADLEGASGGVVQHFDGATTRVHLAPLARVRLHVTSQPDGAFTLIDSAIVDPPFVYPVPPPR